MRLLSKKVAAALVVTVAGLALVVSSVEADQGANANQDAFNANFADNNAQPGDEQQQVGAEWSHRGGHHHHKKHGKHHHHVGHKSHRKSHHSLPMRQLNLVCDSYVIDHIKCRARHRPASKLDKGETQNEAAVSEAQTSWTSENNGGHDQQVYIVMDKPCSKKLPAACAAEVAAEEEASDKADEEADEEADKEEDEADESTDEADDDDDEADEADETDEQDDQDDGQDDDQDEEDDEKEDDKAGDVEADQAVNQAVDQDGLAGTQDESNLWAHKKHKQHGKHSKHRKHRKHAKHAKHRKHRKHGNKKKKNTHPYKDRCVAVGDFCGTQLYGCKFKPNALYRCKEVGKHPELVKICTEGAGCIAEKNGRGSCDSKCNITKPVCGSELPPEYKADPNTVYHCNNGKLEILKVCLPGTKCSPRAGKDPVCGFEDCTCGGDGEFCSSQFPETCGLQENSIYKCVGTGKPELVKKCSTVEECVALADGSACASKDCKCPRDGTVCGDIFPASCRLSSVSLYKCKKGESPVLDKSCLPGRCVGTKTVYDASKVFVDDVCQSSCMCTAAGKFCGSTFPGGCKLNPQGLYTCTAKGVAPVLEKACENGCISRPGGGSCNSKCDLTKPVCGSELPPEYKADPNTVYHCNNGKLEILKVCLPGTKCSPRAGKDPVCGFEDCTCGGDGEFCSSQFPETCGLQENSIYKCVGTGKPELVKKCSTVEECVALADGSACASKDCKCPRDGTVCGDIFPASCRLSSVSLYKCKKGESPVLDKSCLPGRCVGTKTVYDASKVFVDDVCQDSCMCTAAGKFCGSTFPGGCKFNPQGLYTCTAKGASPAMNRICEYGCISLSGGGRCKGGGTDPYEPCKCPGSGTGPVCGYDLPLECKADPGTIYFCPEGKDTKPVPREICKPGTQCQPRPLPVGAICGTSTCDCKGDYEVCGSTFPDQCGLDKTSIYKCTSDGKLQLVKKCDGSQECVSLSDGATCGNKDCKCPDTGSICGESFPRSCMLISNGLYACAKGEPPVFQRDCYPDRCSSTKASMAAAAVFSAEATNDKCTDACTCAQKGLVCGSTFPPRCGYQSSTLYKCDGSGTKPTAQEQCGPGGCTVHGGDDSCNKDDCTCPGTGFSPVCGHELPDSCRADLNTIYVCPGGHGTRPVPLEICRPGSQCQKKPLPLGATCGGSTCDCKGDYEVCGVVFPEECGFDKDVVYKCTTDGTPQRVKKCIDGEECVTVSDGATCTNGDCKCSDDGTLCGEVFPLRCRLSKTTLYTCKKGQDPVPLRDCYPERCMASRTSMSAAAVFSSMAADTCSDTCKCTGKGNVCGSTFPPKCNYAKSTLYRCDGPGTDPKKISDCDAGGCTVNPGDDICNPDDCTCSGTTPAPTCGSELPASCRADPNTIYICPGGRGTRPVPVEICVPGTQCQKKPLPIGAICGGGTCDCKGDMEVCGITFPDNCGLDKNSVYRCTSTGQPQLVKKCDGSQTCVNLADGATCVSDDCKCPDDGVLCGEFFPLSCKLSKTTLYACVKGQSPRALQNCYPERCTTSKATMAAEAVFAAQAVSDQCSSSCLCAGKGLICGSTFPPRCGLVDSILYKCDGKGQTPTPQETCGAGGCTVNTGDDSCNKDDCTCPGTSPVCGSDLPASCKADPNTIYRCPGGKGTKPEPVKICRPGDKCIKKPDPVGAICGSETCNCTGDHTMCSNGLPDNCQVVSNSVYKCDGKGGLELVKKCDGTETCVEKGTKADCVSNDCKCPDDGTVCGEVFPLSCKLKATALYSCKKGQNPTYLKDCYPNRCSSTSMAAASAAEVFVAEASNDQCVDSCKCSEAGLICGSTFPAKCNLKGTSLYKCTGAGVDPVLETECTKGCVVNAGDDSCTASDDCKCKDKDDVCGNAFPSACKLISGALYSCSAGAGTNPVLLKTCPDNQCDVQVGPDQCKPGPCECKDTNPVCGSTLPDSCGLDKSTLYQCTKKGEKPSGGQKCESGECKTTSGKDQCTPVDPCACKDTNPVCGSSLPDSCGLDKASVYQCTKKGDKPSGGQKCESGQCKNTNGKDQCVPVDTCVCKDTDAACGSAFPDSCGLDKTSLYQCPTKGGKPTNGQKCESGECLVQSGPDVCKPKPPDTCKCQDADPVCGKAFDAKCNLKAETLYTCTGKDAVPQAGTECKAGCVVSAGPDKCAVDPCVCKDTNPVCGSTLPESCGLDKGTLYQCTKKDEKPSGGQKCESGECKTTNGKDQCTPVDPCACKDTNPVCGSSLPDSCGLDKASVYQCTKKGDKPSGGQKCESGQCKNTNGKDQCVPVDTCVCKDTDAACGSAFPDSCGLDKTSLYQCPTKGGKPTNGQKCESGECLVQSGPDVCKPKPPDTCKCQDADPVCGKVFDAKCNLKAETLYTCTGKDAVPQAGTECKAGCVVSAGPDKCAVDPCVCKDTNPVCGSSLPDSCGLDKGTLYQCTKKDEKPSGGQKCESGECKTTNGKDQCTPVDPCACKDTNPVCGSSLPDSCGLDKATLYQCTKKGDKPSGGQKCESGECKTANGKDQCVPVDTCVCKDTDAACGSAFPDSCGLDKTSLYQCPTKGGKPTNGQKCESGECLVQSGPDVCKPKPPDTCKCQDADPVCGKAFDAKCNLKAETLYTCTGKDAVPQAGTECKAGCVVSAGPDKCAVDPCVCKDTNPVCGSSLPDSCGLDKGTLYQCTKKDEKPSGGQKCESGECKTTNGKDQCTPVDPCACKDTDAACGSAFPDSCGLDKTSLYQCPTKGGKPTNGQKCESGECLVQSGPDVCKPKPPDTCKCQDADPVCGKAFDAKCNLKAETLYTCTGKDAVPQVGTECKAGCVVSAGPDKCAVDPCLCKDNTKVCGSTFPTTCGLKPQTLYNCSAAGATPVAAQDCPVGCTTLEGDDSCAVDCTCKNAEDTCGSEFPTSCNLDIGTLYDCSAGAKTNPKVKEKCSSGKCTVQSGNDICELVCKCTGTDTKCSKEFDPLCKLPAEAVYKCTNGVPAKVKDCQGTEVCKNTTAGPACISPDCLCKDDHRVCGSTFPATCNLANDTLYQCKTGEAPTIVKDCKPGVCSPYSVKATAAFGAMTDDFCIDQCACKATEPVCASTFDPVCGFDNKTLLNCAGVGDKPTVNQTCTAGCEVLPGPDKCKDDPCTCKKVGDTCGSAYPSSCGYESNTLYSCKAIGEKPEKKSACTNDQVCIQIPGGNDICGNSDSCKCQGTGKVCGNVFPPKCNYTANTAVQCPEGTTTVCVFGCVNGECKTDCKCPSDGDKCGSSFADKCNLSPNSLYTCKAGADPVLKGDCGNQACVKGDPNDICTDPCKCQGNRKTCGSKFPDSCKLEKDPLYNCTGIGSTPVKIEACVAGCLHTSPDNSCNSPCNNQTDAVLKLIESTIASIVNVTSILGVSPVESLVLKNLTSTRNITTPIALSYPVMLPIINLAKANITTNRGDLVLLEAAAGSLLRTTLGLVPAVRRMIELGTNNGGWQWAEPLINNLKLMLVPIRELIVCTKLNATDCVGIEAYYYGVRDASASLIAFLANIPGNDMTALNTMNARVKNATDGVDLALRTNDSSRLDDSGKQLNLIIGQTSGNRKKYFDTSDGVDTVFNAAKSALICRGFNVTIFGDKCSAYRQRLQGALADFVKVIENILGQIPIIGPLIAKPALEAIQKELVDLQNGLATAVAGILSIVRALGGVLGLVPQNDVTDQISEYLLNIVGITDVPGDCGGGPKDCFTLVKIIQFLMDGILNIIRAVPILGPIAAAGIQPLSDAFFKAVESGSVAIIQTAYLALSGINTLIQNLPLVGRIAEPIKIFLDGCKKILDCLIANQIPTPTTIGDPDAEPTALTFIG